MANRILLPGFIVIGAVGAPQLLAQAPIDLQHSAASATQCPATPDQANAQIKCRALTGFARRLAGHVRMIGRTAPCALG